MLTEEQKKMLNDDKSWIHLSFQSIEETFKRIDFDRLFAKELPKTQDSKDASGT